MKRGIYLVLALGLGLANANGEEYTAHGYANGVKGAHYKMPGTLITGTSELEVNNTGVVTCYYYDIADISGPDLKKDTAVTFGIYTQNNPEDTGGQDKRGFSTNKDPKYAPIRWNGGSNLWRQGGQWARYTIDFDAETYNFVYRGNINDFATQHHTFILKIFDPADMSSAIYERNIDLTSGFQSEGEIKDNILRLGGGNNETDWFKVLDDIELSAGTYVVELSSPEVSYAHASWGVFTFNISAGYKGEPYNNEPFTALTDTVAIYQFDKINTGEFFAEGDSGVTAGVYNTSFNNGNNIRNYTDVLLWDAVAYNNNTETMQANGAWYKYTVNFTKQAPYYFCFKGLKIEDLADWDATIEIIEPNTNNLITSYKFSDGLKNFTKKDSSEELRWLYINKQGIIPAGTYVIKIDIPELDTTGVLSKFCFSDQNPANLQPLVRTFNWPETVANDPDLHSNLYTVKVQQDSEEYELFLHKSKPDVRPSQYPPDNGGNGVQNVLYDRTFNFGQFEFTDEIIVEATKDFGTVASRVEIQPKAYGINPFYFDGRTVKFKLKHQENRPSYISINFVSNDNTDDQDLGGQKAVKHGLMLFGDKPEIYKPDTTQAGTVFYSDDADSASVVNANLIYFRAGDYDLKKVFKRGVIDLTKNGQHIYVEGGAYVRGAIWSNGKDDIWLYGRGIISGWDMLFHELLDENGRKDAFLRFIGSDNCHFEGFTIVDPVHHSIPSDQNSYFKNVKIIGWSYNQDGTRVGGGSHMEEMFTKTQDDRDYADRAHTYINSVEWPMRNGAFGMLGWGSYDGGNATYDNIYMINSEWERPEDRVGNQAVIGSNLKQGANQRNNIIRNLSLEDYTTLLCILRINYEPNEGDPWKPSDPGEIKDFLFENIKLERPFITTNGTKKYNRIEGFVKDGIKATVHDITFRNLVAGGELVLDHNKDKYFYIDPATTYNINFEAVGEVHTIRTSKTSGGNVFPNGDIAVPDGTDQYVTIEPNSGYRIKDVKVDYQSVGPLPIVNLTNVTSDHHIEVEFEIGENSFDLADLTDPNSVLTDTIDFGVDHINPSTPIKSIEWKDALLVFPNPASTFIEVVKLREGSEVVMYNKLGQRILSTTKSSIDVSAISDGLYIVKCEGRFAKVLVVKQ